MIDLKKRLERLTRLQRLVLVAGAVWFMFVFGRGLPMVLNDYESGSALA